MNERASESLYRRKEYVGWKMRDLTYAHMVRERKSDDIAEKGNQRAGAKERERERRKAEREGKREEDATSGREKR